MGRYILVEKRENFKDDQKYLKIGTFDESGRLSSDMKKVSYQKMKLIDNHTKQLNILFEQGLSDGEHYKISSKKPIVAVLDIYELDSNRYKSNKSITNELFKITGVEYLLLKQEGKKYSGLFLNEDNTIFDREKGIAKKNSTKISTVEVDGRDFLETYIFGGKEPKSILVYKKLNIETEIIKNQAKDVEILSIKDLIKNKKGQENQPVSEKSNQKIKVTEEKSKVKHDYDSLIVTEKEIESKNIQGIDLIQRRVGQEYAKEYHRIGTYDLENKRLKFNKADVEYKMFDASKTLPWQIFLAKKELNNYEILESRPIVVILDINKSLTNDYFKDLKISNEAFKIRGVDFLLVFKDIYKYYGFHLTKKNSNFNHYLGSAQIIKGAQRLYPYYKIRDGDILETQINNFGRSTKTFFYRKLIGEKVENPEKNNTSKQSLEVQKKETPKKSIFTATRKKEENIEKVTAVSKAPENVNIQKYDELKNMVNDIFELQRKQANTVQEVELPDEIESKIKTFEDKINNILKIQSAHTTKLSNLEIENYHSQNKGDDFQKVLTQKLESLEGLSKNLQENQQYEKDKLEKIELSSQSTQSESNVDISKIESLLEKLNGSVEKSNNKEERFQEKVTNDVDMTKVETLLERLTEEFENNANKFEKLQIENGKNSVDLTNIEASLRDLAQEFKQGAQKVDQLRKVEITNNIDISKVEGLLENIGNIIVTQAQRTDQLEKKLDQINNELIPDLNYISGDIVECKKIQVNSREEFKQLQQENFKFVNERYRQSLINLLDQSAKKHIPLLIAGPMANEIINVYAVSNYGRKATILDCKMPYNMNSLKELQADSNKVILIKDILNSEWLRAINDLILLEDKLVLFTTPFSEDLESFKYSFYNYVVPVNTNKMINCIKKVNVEEVVQIERNNEQIQSVGFVIPEKYQIINEQNRILFNQWNELLKDSDNPEEIFELLVSSYNIFNDVPLKEKEVTIPQVVVEAPEKSEQHIEDKDKNNKKKFSIFGF